MFDVDADWVVEVDPGWPAAAPKGRGVDEVAGATGFAKKLGMAVEWGCRFVYREGRRIPLELEGIQLTK